MAMIFEEQSYWSLLGVAPGATTAEIKRAYARRLREIRPDEDAEASSFLSKRVMQHCNSPPMHIRASGPPRHLAGKSPNLSATMLRTRNVS